MRSSSKHPQIKHSHLMNIETINYGGWPNCLRISNGNVELVATTDVGPRLLRWGFVNGPNAFKEFEETSGRTGDDHWNSYGGHRLWLAPEDDPRSYYPDNEPVMWDRVGDALCLTAPVETTTGMQKEFYVTLHSTEPRATIVHRVTNWGTWPVEFAPWALSVMATGGTCVFPLPTRGGHPEFLLPASTLTLWRFTDMSDPRWTWGRKYILLRQDETATTPQKVGSSVPDGWAAYINGGEMFLKRFRYEAKERYPDMGCNFETFTNADILEVETLGPLVTLEPGQSIEHVEEWSLHRDVPTPASDADVDEHILPLL